MSEILLKAIVEKADAQEKKIVEMQQTFKNALGQTEEVRRVRNEVEELKSSAGSNSFPIAEMQELSNRLAESILLLRAPVASKVIHHHYIPKIILIAAGLFIAFVTVCSGWYMTSNKLHEYEGSDTKYRYLKLYNNDFLRQLLFTTDSLYRVDKNLRNSVEHWEEAIRQRIELQQRIQEKENEVRRLKRKLK